MSRSSSRYLNELRYRESQNLPEEVAQEYVQDNRESIPMVKGQMNTFLFINEFGRTCPPMNTVTDTSEKPMSRILSVNWYDLSIRENERLRGQFIGQSYVQSS